VCYLGLTLCDWQNELDWIFWQIKSDHSLAVSKYSVEKEKTSKDVQIVLFHSSPTGHSQASLPHLAALGAVLVCSAAGEWNVEL
jgi:hypothetical protein